MFMENALWKTKKAVRKAGVGRDEPDTLPQLQHTTTHPGGNL